MIIKDIIDAERWGVEDEHGHYGCQVYKHNATLDRIESAVTKRIAELKSDNNHVFYRVLIGMGKRITELEDLLVDSGERIKKQSTHITELEAQVPKVISPKNGTCMCGNVVRGFDPVHYGWKNNYCPNCGAKLNWEDA